MMKSRGSRVCLCIGAALLASSPQALGAGDSVTRKPVVLGDLGAKIDEYLTRLTAFGFSGALIAAKDGEVVIAKGYGFANRKRRLPVTPDTVFTIGSITKQFTGAAILKLEMQGKLSVNDPITKYFDNVPKDKADITIHHLLTHTAGLVDGLGGDFDLKATRDWVRGQPAVYSIGTSSSTYRTGTGHSSVASTHRRRVGCGLELPIFSRETVFCAGRQPPVWSRPQTALFTKLPPGSVNWMALSMRLRKIMRSNSGLAVSTTSSLGAHVFQRRFLAATASWDAARNASSPCPVRLYVRRSRGHPVIACEDRIPRVPRNTSKAPPLAHTGEIYYLT